MNAAYSPRYTKNTGGHLSHRVLLVTGDEPLRSRQLPAPPNERQIQALAARAAASVRANRVHVEPSFLSGKFLAEAREAAQAMLRSDDDTVQAPLLHVMSAVEALRVALGGATGRPLCETGELQLVYYEPGGGYQRHIDWKPGMQLGPSGRTDVRRALSLLVYLTPDDWNAATDGGCLRVFAPQPRSAALQPAAAAPGAYVDVQPTAGSLVIFNSSTVPHEVLTTQRERLLIAGWLHEGL